MLFHLTVEEGAGLSNLEGLALAGELRECLDNYSYEVEEVTTDPPGVSFHAEDDADAQDALDLCEQATIADGWIIKLGVAPAGD